MATTRNSDEVDEKTLAVIAHAGKGNKEVMGINEAVVVEMPAPFSKPLLKLYCYCAAAFLSATMSGTFGSPSALASANE